MSDISEVRSRANKPDRFYTFFKFLLDETGLFTRSEWAKLLGVREDNIEHWLSWDFALPPNPRSLCSILDALCKAGTEGVEERLAEIGDLPLREICGGIISSYSVGSLYEYLCSPLVIELRNELHGGVMFPSGEKKPGLPFEQRKKVLQDALDAARKIKE